MKTKLAKVSVIIPALLLIAAYVWIACHDNWSVRLTHGTDIIITKLDTAKIIIGEKDEFIERMSPLTRSLVMKSAQVHSDVDILDKMVNNVEGWSRSERTKLVAMIEILSERLDGICLNMPNQIYLVKTTGQELFECAYTRGNAIFIPKSRAMNENYIKTLAHEIYHVASRYDNRTRNELYRAIGFKQCNAIEYPGDLKKRILTNPDALVNDHYITITQGDNIIDAIPILFASCENYDHSKELKVSDMRAELIKVIMNGNKWEMESENWEDSIVEEILRSDYYKQVGINPHNIFYNIYHPDEIIADYFEMIATKRKYGGVNGTVRKIRTILFNKSLFDDEVDIKIIENGSNPNELNVLIDGKEVNDLEAVKIIISNMVRNKGKKYAWIEIEGNPGILKVIKFINECKKIEMEVLTMREYVYEE